MLEGSFRRKYRMEQVDFDALVEALRPHIENSRCRGWKGRVPKERMVALTLRWLAGASYLDVMDVHGISKATVYGVVDRVVSAINKSSVGRFDFENNLEARANSFRARSTMGILSNCVGAVDGLFVKIICPRSSETLNVRRFWSGHKHGYGLNLQA